MKPLRWILLLLFGLALSLWYSKHPNTETLERATPLTGAPVPSSSPADPRLDPALTTSPTPQIKTLTVQTFALPDSAKNQNKINPRYTQKPKDLTVEFEIINGLAIAYGDTILGKPIDGFSGKRGIAEIAHPQTWDGGIVPFSIPSNLPHPERILKAIEVFQQTTSVKFVPYEGQKDAVVFERGEEQCYSYLGRMGGIQPISLSDRCQTPQILHELMHALGFIHEQSRIDRDQYLEILWENIQEPFQAQFAMGPEAWMANYFDSPFDSKSIMMYEPHSFAVSPKLETMRLKRPGAIEPSENSLSPIDVERVNRLYRND